MADYYPLIARAVAGLERNTGDGRRALYERARSALVAQLRGVTPALSESDVTRERLALEEAIRKLDAESARQTLAGPTPQKETCNRRPATGDRRSLLDSGLAGLRSALSETSELAGATARSAKSARDNVAPVPREDDMLQDAPAPHMLEPAMDDETMPSRARMAPLS